MKIKLVKRGAYSTGKQIFHAGRTYEVSKEEFDSLPNKKLFAEVKEAERPLQSTLPETEKAPEAKKKKSTKSNKNKTEV